MVLHIITSLQPVGSSQGAQGSKAVVDGDDDDVLFLTVVFGRVKWATSCAKLIAPPRKPEEDGETTLFTSRVRGEDVEIQTIFGGGGGAGDFGLGEHASVDATRSVFSCVANSRPRGDGSRGLEARSATERNVLPNTDAGIVGGLVTLNHAAGDVANEVVLGFTEMTEHFCRGEGGGNEGEKNGDDADKREEGR